jgi:peptide/nickel transport system permease protein
VRLIARKLIALVVVLLVVTTMSFLLLELLPASPATVSLGPFATKAAIAEFNHTNGLDKPFLVQYGRYVTGVLHGDLGHDFLNHEAVYKAVKERLPVTFELLVLSQLLALLVAIPLGILSAYRPDGLIDRLSATVTFGLLAAPPFVIALPLVLFLAVNHHVFPATGYVPISHNLTDNLRSAVLPSIVLALPSMASYLRLLRADMIATLQEDYITMAKAKGLPTWRILMRHAFRPSTFSLITVGGLQVGALIGGTVIVETIFQLPGIGYLTIVSITERNYAMVQGTVLVIAIGYVLVNFLVDILYTIVDPRVRHVGARA